MKALRDIYDLKISEPFKLIYARDITHKTYKTKLNEWVMPKEVVVQDGKFIREKLKKF